jgi:ABC-type Zn uptake system ZnuABC Zn-binding protein ZnuA
MNLRILHLLLPIFVIGALLAACVAPMPVPTSGEVSTTADAAADEHADEHSDEHAHEAATVPAELPTFAAVDLSDGRKLQVVATTNIVADVVTQVAGDSIDLYAMLPVGADPHSYQPTPQDLRALTDADVIFINGLGLEEAMALTLEEFEAKTVVVNTGIEAVEFGGEETHEEHADEEHADEEHADEEHADEEHADEEHADEEHADEAGHDHAHDGADPHSWFSVHAVEKWTHNIHHVLSDLDPANAEAYESAASAYAEELEALHAELVTLVDALPTEKRKLVTDHDSLGYLAAEYGFEVVGSVIPSFSTLAEPSAQDLAELQEQIRAEGVTAIFVGTTINPRQETQMAEDLGIQVVSIYTGSLSEADGPAATYIDFMRYNVGKIVGALGAED